MQKHRIEPIDPPAEPAAKPRGLTDGRRQQPYDHEGATSSDQESFGGGGDYRGELDLGGFSDQDFGSQGYSGQGYGDRSYGDPDYGGQTFARRTGDEAGADTDAGAAPGEVEASIRRSGNAPGEDGVDDGVDESGTAAEGPGLPAPTREP
jgi:hypothetical protein